MIKKSDQSYITGKALAVEKQISIFPVLLVNFIGTLGYSIILPFLIILVLMFGGNELTYGILGATYSFFQLIGAPLLGKWSDRYGRKKILLLSQAGTFLAWVIFLIALLIPNKTLINLNSSAWGAIIISAPLIMLFFARAFDGITGGNVSVANAYLADITTEKYRKSNFGKMAASANLGFIIGPAMAGLLGGTILGELLPVLLAMLISLIAIFVIAFLMSESNPCVILQPLESCKIKKVFGQEHKDCYEIAESNKITFREILKLNHIPFLLILYFIIFLAFNFYYVAFPVHAVERLKWNLLELGIFFSVMGFIMVLVQGPVLAKISNKFSDSHLTITGSILLGASFFFFTGRNEVFIYSGVVLFSCGNGIMWPSYLSILSKVAGKKYQGAIQGYASSAGSLASILGLIFGGLLYGLLGETIFWIPGILLLIIFGISFKLLAIQKPDPTIIEE